MIQNRLMHRPNPQVGVVRRLFYLLSNYGVLSVDQEAQLGTYWSGWLNGTFTTDEVYHELTDLVASVSAASGSKFNHFVSVPLAHGSRIFLEPEVINYVNFIPSDATGFILSDGKTFKVKE